MQKRMNAWRTWTWMNPFTYRSSMRYAFRIGVSWLNFQPSGIMFGRHLWYATPISVPWNCCLVINIILPSVAKSACWCPCRFWTCFCGFHVSTCILYSALHLSYFMLLDNLRLMYITCTSTYKLAYPNKHFYHSSIRPN
jgi:hypothetical protein